MTQQVPQPTAQVTPILGPQKRSHTVRNILIIALVIIVALIVIGAVVVASFMGLFLGGHSIVGDNLSQSVTISSSTTYSILGDMNTLTFTVSSNVVFTLHVTGDSSQITILGGSSKISVTGDYNTIYATGTNVLSSSNTGTGNSIT